MNTHTAAKNLEVFQAAGYTTEAGQQIPPHALYRYVDQDGKGGPRYATLEMAEKSWQRKHPA